MIARQKVLYQDSLRLWPVPETDFKPSSELPSDGVPLDEPCDFTNQGLFGFTFRNEVRKTTLWKEMLLYVIKQCSIEHPKEVERFAQRGFTDFLRAIEKTM